MITRLRIGVVHVTLVVFALLLVGRAAQVQLPPPAADLRAAERRGQCAGLAAQLVGAVPDLGHLLRQLCLP